MKQPRLLFAIAAALVIVFVCLPEVLSLRASCAAVLNATLCKPIVSGLMGGAAFLAIYPVLAEIHRIRRNGERAPEHGDYDSESK